MRFQSGFAVRAERVAMETRAIERPSGVQQVLAPAGWSDVRIEAWLDWVEAEGRRIFERYYEDRPVWPNGAPPTRVQQETRERIEQRRAALRAAQRG